MQTNLSTSRDRGPSRFYRPELDALRFFAFLLVFVHHSLRNASLSDVLHAGANPTLALFGRLLDLVHEVGNFGMCLFFFLSAFLITELLLLENARTNRIHVGSFYMRRILRIWPLYFGFLAFSYVLGRIYPVNYMVTGKQVLYYVLLSGNWYNIYFGFFPASLGVLWSISVEEHFYLLWPSLVKLGKGKAGVVAGIVLFSVASIAAMVWLGSPHAVNQEVVWENSFVQFIFFALGAALALAVNSRGIPRITASLRVILFVAAFGVWFACAYFTGIRRNGAQVDAYRILAGYGLMAAGTILLFLSFLGILASRIPAWLRSLGKVSYGLYVFHELCLGAGAQILGSLAHHLNLHGVRLAGIKLLVTPVAFIATVVLALLSYRYFESPFLRLRRRYTVVESRPV